MKNKFSIIFIGVLLISGFAISATASDKIQNCCGQSCCKLMNNSGQNQEQTAHTMHHDGIQTVTVEINKQGFNPSDLKLKAGVPVKLTFIRKTDETCAKAVEIKEYTIQRDLPLNKPITVEFTPRKGEFTFTCGMNMMTGKLIVE